MTGTLSQGRLAVASGFIERHDLLAKLYILMLCLILALPNVWAVRTLYYVAVLPVFLILLTQPHIRIIIRPIALSPVSLLAIGYFVIFAITAPLAADFTVRTLVDHVRSSLLVISFVGMTALLVLRYPQFPFTLFLFLGVLGAVVGLNNVWHFYGGLPPLDTLPRRLEGIPGLTMYYNANWVAQIYGVLCVGTAAVAMRPGTPRSAVALLAISALALLACVMLTQTRSVLIGVVAGIALIVLLLPRQTALQRVIQLAVIAFIGLASLPFIEILISRGDPYRLAFWQAYLSHVEAHPWAGAGLTAQIVAKAPDGFETTHPHNIVYHALLRGGAFAMAALIALLTAACVQAVRAWQITGSALYPALMVVALLPLQLEFTVVVGTSVGWDWLVLWMPIGLCVGAALADPARAGSRFAETNQPG